MKIRYLLAIWVGKSVQAVLTLLGRSAGGTWPGEIAIRVAPRILRFFAAQLPTIILVAGTNGKTTTTKMIQTILSFSGKGVVRNESGANLDNGIVSTFLKDSKLTGRLRSRYFIFEVDEASLPVILKHLTPSVIVLLNLFRDQLDRYGEVDTIAEKWRGCLAAIPPTTRVIINADDPHLAFIGGALGAKVSYFGIDDPALYRKKIQHATDTIYCPNCGKRLTFGGVYFSHLGKWSCGSCGFTHPIVSLRAQDVVSPLDGVYNIYNSLAAVLVAREIGISSQMAQDSLKTFIPAFGRMETIVQNGKTIKILLSKNPTGFNESIQAALSSGGTSFMFVLNDRIPDGRDVSWIWDVDFDVLDSNKTCVLAGDRAYDLGLRLKYAGKKYVVITSLEEAIWKAIADIKTGETLWILATYSAMLEVRGILTGKKIL
jgi:UDP-N-acetylmuramyl tripeptide synthase